MRLLRVRGSFEQKKPVKYLKTNRFLLDFDQNNFDWW